MISLSAKLARTRKLLLVVTLSVALTLGTLGIASFAQPASAGLPMPTGAPTSSSLVISQVYGGGGNANAPWQNDFIEIFNPTASSVTVSGWSVQYASATGGTWATTNISGIIPAGGYYLVREAVGSGCSGAPCGLPLPAPDATGNIAMSATAGKVALVNTTTALTAVCGANCHADPSVVDYIGFGTATDFEGAGPAPGLSNTASDLRNANGCTDTDNNAADFTVTTTINARNSASSSNPCGGGGPTNTPSSTVTPGGPTFTPTSTNTPGVPTSTPTATNTPGAQTRIHDIQGASHISPRNGQTVTNVQGIVTALDSNGFYLQDTVTDADNATSEAIFVFTSSAPTVSLGQLVSVNGRVQEFRPGGSGGTTNLTTTELGSPVISVLSSGNPLPTPVVIGNGGRIPPSEIIEDQNCGDVELGGCAFDPDQDGLDFYESLESMRVQLNNPVAVGPTNSFGEIAVVGDMGANASVRTSRGGIVIQPNDFNPERVILDDGLATTPNVNTGDYFTGSVLGIMSYNFSNFKFLVTQIPTPTSGGLAREISSTPGPNQLAISTFNMENLDPGDPPSKFQTLASLIVNNLRSPDLVNMEEVQDNNGPTDSGVVDADVTIGMLIQAIQNAGGPTYQYRQINPVDDQDGGEPGGNIRVGFLFRTDRGLSFVDRPGGCSTCATTVNPGPELSFSPGRIDPNNPAFNSSRKPLAGEFLYNGQKFFVIGNHFNSKGGDDPLFGRYQQPQRSSEVQRNQQAQIVNNFVGSILAQDPNAHVVVLGDLNDFYFSSALTTLKGGIMTALIETLPLPERYTYVFDGNSQDLDQILVTNNMVSTVALYDPVHVNAEFYDQASDHDPVLAIVNFPSLATPTATSTPTSTPSTTLLVGHVTWQGPPAQPSVRQQLPLTLTLCISGAPVDYGATTDSSGFFTVTTDLPTGSYSWRAKGPRYLATAGTVAITGGSTNQVEMGQQKAGDVDATHNDVINITDFNVLKGVFGTASSVGDLNNDGVTNVTDFTLLKGNFGQAGAAINCP